MFVLKDTTNFKTKEKKYKSYSKESLQKAINDVENKTLNKFQAANRYGISYSTLSDNLNHKYKKPGR